MILYYSSAKPLVAGILTCNNPVCSVQGVGLAPHITASTKPLAGVGEYLFTTEVNPQTITRYKYSDPFRKEGGEFYALPLPLAEKYQWREADFFEVAHDEWNRFHILLFNGKDFYNQHDTETWANVWISRPDIVKAEITEDIHDFAGHRKKASLVIQPEFDPQTDYLLVEERWRKPSLTNVGSWKLKLYAGTLPQWAFFPWAWVRWVQNASVQRSALMYILGHCATVRREVDFAISQSHIQQNRVNTARAWRIVADSIGKELGFDLGHIDYGSDTAVRAMPLKIAGRMARGPVPPWEPPIPRPTFIDPDESGRVLLISPEGVYPRKASYVQPTLNRR